MLLAQYDHFYRCWNINIPVINTLDAGKFLTYFSTCDRETSERRQVQLVRCVTGKLKIVLS